MSISVRGLFFTLSALAVLAGCSDGPSGATPPLEGWATKNSVVGNGSAFGRQDVRRIVLVSGERSLKKQAVEVAISDDGSRVKLFLNDKTIFLHQDPNSPLEYDDKAGETYVWIRPDANPDVKVVYVRRDTDPFSATTGYENAGAFVIGYQTNPSQVSRLSGKATYSGGSTAEIRLDSDMEIMTGTADLVADFSRNSVSGTVFLADAYDTNPVNINDILIELNPTDLANIAFNGFRGYTEVYVDQNGTWVKTTDGKFDGHFYGVDGSSIGGTYWFKDASGGQIIFLQGAFTGQQ